MTASPLHFGSARRLARAGLIAVVAALIATLLISVIAHAIFSVPSQFRPLRASSIVGFTIIGVLAATVACAALNRFARSPLAAFGRIAPAALVISYAPDVAIWAAHAYHHTATAKTVVPLMVMHLAVGVICILVLTALGVESSPSPIVGDSPRVSRPSALT